MKRNKTIVSELNKLFPPTDPKHPVAFICDGMVKVNAEYCATETHFYGGIPETFEVTLADYYECYMSDELVKYADSVDGYFEWENSGCLVLVIN